MSLRDVSVSQTDCSRRQCVSQPDGSLAWWVWRLLILVNCFHLSWCETASPVICCSQSWAIFGAVGLTTSDYLFDRRGARAGVIFFPDARTASAECSPPTPAPWKQRSAVAEHKEVGGECFLMFFALKEGEIRDLISDLLVWKSDSLLTLLIHVLASTASCTVQNKQLTTTFPNFYFLIFLNSGPL